MGGAVERRAALRRVPDEGEPLVRVRLRTGHDVAVLDVSDRGLRVDGRARLLPGSHVDVHVVSADGRVLARCRVVRSEVSALDGGVRYRSALAFQSAIDTRSPGYAFPIAASGPPTAGGTTYPEVATNPGADLV